MNFYDDPPNDPEKSLQFFREQLAAYHKGLVSRGELIGVIIPHAAICDPAVLYAELPGEFQEWLVERCGEFLPPDTELITISGAVHSFRQPERILSEEEKRKIQEQRRKDKEISDQRATLKPAIIFTNSSKKQGKSPPSFPYYIS